MFISMWKDVTKEEEVDKGWNACGHRNCIYWWRLSVLPFVIEEFELYMQKNILSVFLFLPGFGE
jgi:hypothetical protein